MVDLNAAFGEQFFEVAVGQVVAQVPAHRQQDDSDGNRKPTNAEAGTADKRVTAPWSPVGSNRASDAPRRAVLSSGSILI